MLHGFPLLDIWCYYTINNNGGRGFLLKIKCMYFLPVQFLKHFLFTLFLIGLGRL